jgi:hypothetical protein
MDIASAKNIKQNAKQAAVAAAKQAVYQSGEAAKSAVNQIIGGERLAQVRAQSQDRGNSQFEIQKVKDEQEAYDKKRFLELKESLERLLQQERRKRLERDKEWQESQSRAMQAAQQTTNEIPFVPTGVKKGPGLIGRVKHAVKTRLSELSGKTEKRMGNKG